MSFKYVDEEITFVRTIIVTAICMMATVVLATPLFQTPSFNDIVDAVQNEKLSRQQIDIEALKVAIAQMDSKINYILGGIAGMWAIMMVFGTIQAIILKKTRQ